MNTDDGHRTPEQWQRLRQWYRQETGARFAQMSTEDKIAAITIMLARLNTQFTEQFLGILGWDDENLAWIVDESRCRLHTNGADVYKKDGKLLMSARLEYHTRHRFLRAMFQQEGVDYEKAMLFLHQHLTFDSDTSLLGRDEQGEKNEGSAFLSSEALGMLVYDAELDMYFGRTSEEVILIPGSLFRKRQDTIAEALLVDFRPFPRKQEESLRTRFLDQAKKYLLNTYEWTTRPDLGWGHYTLATFASFLSWKAHTVLSNEEKKNQP